MRQLVNQLNSLSNQTVTVSGWVNSRRDHGGLIFIDLRDHTGVIQLVITPETSEAFALAGSLRDEFVISATGLVRSRAENLTNPNLETGNIELLVESLSLLNRAQTPPVNTHDDGPESSEELRPKYRYLDLRRPSMQKLLTRRARYYQYLRDFMSKHDFIEITTPILANSSPEGARDFLVPSRLHPGKFYALPQAPQQFKQLLMVGGVHRYYQIAPCFRDEDPRADRLYGDFYQLDLEMSFVEDGETVRQTVEPLIKNLVTDFAGKTLVFETIPRLSYTEAINNYGTDKPDLRYDLKLIDLTEALQATNFKVFQTEAVKAICVPGGARLTRSEIDKFTELAKKHGAGGLAYFLYQEGTIKSPITKFLTESEISSITSIVGAKDGDAVFFAAASLNDTNRILGQLRIAFAEHFGLIDSQKVALCWVTDFPFYEWNQSENRLDFGHNPFSLPKGGLAALTAATTDQQKLALLADQYDMVMNGYEICSGAVRNYQPEVMYQVFAALGYDQAYVESRFGGLLSAFKFGAPPHAGCAFGLDRIFMVLEDQTNIRNIIAFPKNGSGVDLMMDSPSFVDPKLLEETNLSIIPPSK